MNNEWKESRTLSTAEMIFYTIPNLGITAIISISVSFTLIFYINVLGQPPIIAGGIYSAALFLFSIMCIFGGIISDRFGKKAHGNFSTGPYHIFYPVMDAASA